LKKRQGRGLRDRMAWQVVRHGLSMREAFDVPRLQAGGWNPRHMNRGRMQVQAKLHGVDAVLEVHDARIPLTGRNPALTDIGIIRPSVLLINKIDLVHPTKVKRMQKYFEKEHSDKTVLFTDCKASKDSGLSQVVSSIAGLLDETSRYNRAEEAGVNVLVVGIPNVGKSSVINALRNANMHRRSRAEVAPRPGVTKHVMEKTLISWKPRTYVRDTPGILAPRIVKPESGLKLALTNTILNNVVDLTTLADFLLFWLNKRGRHEYVEVLELKAPTDDITNLLAGIALRTGLTFQKREPSGAVRTIPNFTGAAQLFIERWRRGDCGCQLLDDVPY